MIKIHNNIRKYKEIIRVAFAFRVKSLVIHLVNLAKEQKTKISKLQKNNTCNKFNILTKSSI